jgi:hypothetical protein
LQKNGCGDVGALGRLLPSRFEESHFWRQNSYSLRRQGLTAVFEATKQSRRDRTQKIQARTLSASRDGGWSHDGEWIELSKNDWRRARARLQGSTVTKGAANFSNYFLLFWSE